MLWRRHEFVARTIVFGKTRILSVRTFVGFGVVQALPPGQRKFPQIRNVTDGHDGLLAAVASLFTSTIRQRCVVYKQRNVLNAIPDRERKEVSAELAAIFKQEKKEDALLNLSAFKAKYQKRYPEAIRSLSEDEEHLLTFYAFPPVMHRYIRNTNAIESFFSNVGQRTDQIDAFTTETSCLTIVWAVMQDIHLPKIPIG